MEKSIDITDVISNGCIKSIIHSLVEYMSMGYTQIYWDGYNSNICVFKSAELPEPSND